MNEHEYVCGLCDKKKLHDATKGHVPPGWRMKSINGKVILLCDNHAHPAHWSGGPSTIVQEMYKNKFGKKITDY